MNKIVLYIVFFIPWIVKAYPIDGYEYTGIERLKYLYEVHLDSAQSVQLKEGALLGLQDINLNLSDVKDGFPKEDKVLKEKLNAIFRYLEPQYSVSVMDITDINNIRYAGLKESVGYQPGSVAKIIAGITLFNEIHRVYGDDWGEIRGLLYTRHVRGNRFVHADHHTIPIYDILNQKYYKRIAKEEDLFSLYEWLDHMFSKSSNAAASVVMREALLIHLLDNQYECATQAEMDDLIQNTDRRVLSAIMEEITNCALEDIGIEHDEFRVGGLFTSGAEHYIPRKGGSIGTTKGLMKFMWALEKGKVINHDISLELKRLMYLTDRRIRYAASSSLNDAAVFFKSGSLYSFKPETGFVKKKYAGNRYNYMNSVAIVEKPASLGGHKYMVALMSNVLRKNSVGEHYALAKKIDALIAELSNEN